MTSSDEVLSYLNKNNIEWKSNDTQIITNCPSCGAEGKVYIGKDNGVWDCKSGSCELNGKSFPFGKYQSLVGVKATPQTKLDNSLLDDYKTRLQQNPAVMNWLLNERKFTPEAIKILELGVDYRQFNTIPHFDKNHKLTGVQLRDPQWQAGSGKDKYSYVTGSKPGLINGHNVFVQGNKQCIIFEGGYDVGAALSYGINKSFPLGVPGAKMRKDKWVEDLSTFDTIYIWYDSDQAGTTGAYDLALRLGLKRCKRVITPAGYKDLNECLVNGVPKQEIINAIQTADHFSVSGVSSTIDFVEEVVNGSKDENKALGAVTGLTAFDKMMKGFKLGKISLFSGFPDAGKTTFAKYCYYNIALRGDPVLIFSMETEPEVLIGDMVSIMGNKSKYTMQPDEIRALVTKINNEVPIHWYNFKGEETQLNCDALIQYAKACRDRYGVKYVLLDDFSFISNNSSNKYKTGVENDDKIFLDLQDSFKRMDMHLSMIAHIKKPESSKEESKMPGMSDLKGSGAVMYKPDYIIMVHRDRDIDMPEEEQKFVEIGIVKNKPGNKRGKIRLKYNTDTCQYEEI